MGPATKTHTNDERTVRCPISGCNEEPLARGVHLHILRSSGDGHGPAGEIPTGIDLDNLETVGTCQVRMDYPERRETEHKARLCPYCERPFRGKHGVMIHLGQVAGRKDHPADAVERHDPDDFAIVRVDENENVVDVVEEASGLPSRQRRLADADLVDEDRIQQYIKTLRDRGMTDEADRAEQLLLD